MYAYLRTQEHHSASHRNASGMLLYPTTGSVLNEVMLHPRSMAARRMYKRMALTNSIARKLAMRLEKCREPVIPCDVGDSVFYNSLFALAKRERFVGRIAPKWWLLFG
jgi:hypothetical protein